MTLRTANPRTGLDPIGLDGLDPSPGLNSLDYRAG